MTVVFLSAILLVGVAFVVAACVAVVVIANQRRQQDNPNLRPCPDCGHFISVRAATCPKCGALVKGI